MPLCIRGSTAGLMVRSYFTLRARETNLIIIEVGRVFIVHRLSSQAFKRSTRIVAFIDGKPLRSDLSFS
jgi:hypothetical protein